MGKRVLGVARASITRHAAVAVIGVGVIAGCCAPVAGAAGGCPHEVLRAENHSLGLPDCRAYEIVSPAFKFDGVPNEENIAPDGLEVVFSTLGAPGEPGDNTTTGGPSYLASRVGSGWGSRSLETSSGSFEDPVIAASRADCSRDLSKVLLQRTPASGKAIDQRIYIRSTSGGEPIQVGPEVPPAKVAAWSTNDAELGEDPELKYAGASPDLSHILFASERLSGGAAEFLWPGDSTVAFYSTYEYVGSGHSGLGSDVPALVGVSDGKTIVGGKTIAAGMLISQCGTVLGAPNTERRAIEVYNAVSEMGVLGEAGVIAEEGARVFFTAAQGGCSGLTEAGTATTGTGPAVNEVYARVNGTQTVAISEPSKEDCSQCDTSAPQEAVFQGASSDGSRVFFLTRQKLLAAAEGIGLYEYNFNAAPASAKVTLIAKDMPESGDLPGKVPVSGVVRVCENGSRVYFVSEEGEELAGNRDSDSQKAKPGKAGEPRPNLYLYNTSTHHAAFIAELAAGDHQDWSVADLRPVQATPDGRYLLLASQNDLTPDAAGKGTQLYRYNAEVGEANAAAEKAGEPPGAPPLTRITTSEEGINENGNTAEYSEIRPPAYTVIAEVQPQGLSITDDGSRVFFTSPWALTRGALNDVCLIGHESEGACIPGAPPAENVYEWENGHTYLISDGKDRNQTLGGGAVSLVGTNPSGTDVFFTTASQLTPSDIDTQQDIYDARIDGGFPPPATPPACQAECQGPFSTAPIFPVPPTTNTTNNSNLTPPSPASLPHKPKPSTQAERLAKALKACRTKHNKHKRVICEHQAHKKYGASHATQTNGKGR